MSVSGELLCSFELLKPLDSAALKNHIKKGRNKRNSILNSPVRIGTLHVSLTSCQMNVAAPSTMPRFIVPCLRLFCFRC